MKSPSLLAAVPVREDPRDALVVAPGRPRTLSALPEDARVGTSSLRRRALLRQERPDLDSVDLRGNLDSRLTRVQDGQYDAILLAFAGLRRMGWEAEVAQLMEPPRWLPAPGQGALGIICRADDAEMRAWLADLDHPATRAAVTAERMLLRTLEGGCQIPIGALATVEDDELRLHAFVAALSGSTAVRGELRGPVASAEQLGSDLAYDMIARGASRILDEVRADGEDGVPRPIAP